MRAANAHGSANFVRIGARRAEEDAPIAGTVAKRTNVFVPEQAPVGVESTACSGSGKSADETHRAVRRRSGRCWAPSCRPSSSACTGSRPRARTQSKNDYPLFIAITYVSFIIFAVVIVAMGYSLWKFRQRGPSDLRDGDPTHGNTLLEIVWTPMPLVIVAVFGVWAAKVLDDNEAHAANGRVHHRHRLQLRLRVPLRQRRRLHAQRRALRAGRQVDHAAHDHAAVHARHARISRSSTASGCRSGASSRTRRRA